MKKCVQCKKDLPDAALHCVFCGSKQPAQAPPEVARTAMGYSADQVREQVAAMPARRASPSAPPPIPSAPAHNPAFAATAFAPPTGARLGSPAPAAQPPSFAAPPAFSPPQMASPPAAAYSPPAPAFAPPAPAFAPPAPAFAPPAPAPSYAPAAAPNAATMYVASPSPSPPAAPAAASAPTAYSPAAFQLPPAYAAAAGYSSPASYQPMPAAAGAPPYLASQTADRAGRPIDPYRDGLRLVLFVFGILLVGAFCTPLSSAPTFHWDLVLASSPVKAKLPALFIAVVGVMSLVLASMPLPSVARGALAALFAGAAVLTPAVMTGLDDWRPLVGVVGELLLIAALLLRHEYRDQVFPKIFVTLAVLAALSPYVVPIGGHVPIQGLLDAIIDAPGKAKIVPILEIAKVAFVILALLAWLPSPSSAGAKAIAWLLIFWPLVTHLQGVILADGQLEVLRTAPYSIAMSWVSAVAYPALLGYGLAAMVGKRLEPR